MGKLVPERARLVQAHDDRWDRNGTQRQYETTFISVENSEQLFSRDIWVADSGASCHITNSDYRAVLAEDDDVTALRHSIDASGNVMETRKLVDITGRIRNAKNGKNITLTMGKCRFGGSKFNLCSLTKLTDNGWKMSGDKLDT